MSMCLFCKTLRIELLCTFLGELYSYLFGACWVSEWKSLFIMNQTVKIIHKATDLPVNHFSGVRWYIKRCLWQRERGDKRKTIFGLN